MSEFHKRAARAARKGDIRAADAAELGYISAFVRLYSIESEQFIRAFCARICRGAGPRGETRVEWALPNGECVYSDIDGMLLPEHEECVQQFAAASPAAAEAA
ncbi:hypothetical protein [Burkholderia ubonensis]|uniref:hypothetical protein n=1 Tax=Burkholderia ubonensis TaxID=101571 RepID=UPI00075AB59B|nr:hypothetical protein [Burkholderia ubonensis]KVO11755.1 hypothetical protein WJ73_19610 [Burkholderia ubonensis]